MIEGITESIMISMFAIYIIGQTSVNEDGVNSDLWLVGLTM